MGFRHIGASQSGMFYLAPCLLGLPNSRHAHLPMKKHVNRLLCVPITVSAAVHGDSNNW